MKDEVRGRIGIEKSPEELWGLYEYLKRRDKIVQSFIQKNESLRLLHYLGSNPPRDCMVTFDVGSKDINEEMKIPEPDE